jgi:chemotaxis protein MotB
MARGGRKRAGHGGGEESEERWLLTYADMITLLMALFMVLFSISSVNISKYQTLQKSLKAAFSGNVLPGGKAISQQGSTQNASHTPASVELQAMVPATTMGGASKLQSSTAHGPAAAAAAAASQAAAQHESAAFAHIKRQLDAYAAKHGFSGKVKTAIERQGLVIRVLTDDLLFASGQATLNSAKADSLLSEIGAQLNLVHTHPINVEGNTDNVPIHGGLYPSNWELSTARASTVVRFLVGAGVGASRLTAVGYADQRPLASDATAAGRARNRRVEIVVQRISGSGSEP